MADERDEDEERRELDDAEIDELDAEQLPDREVLSTVTPVGDTLVPPPITE